MGNLTHGSPAVAVFYMQPHKQLGSYKNLSLKLGIARAVTKIKRRDPLTHADGVTTLKCSSTRTMECWLGFAQDPKPFACFVSIYLDPFSTQQCKQLG